jgi:hypothetical protein
VLHLAVTSVMTPTGQSSKTHRVGELTPGDATDPSQRLDKAVGGSVNVAYQQIKPEGGGA